MDKEALREKLREWFVENDSQGEALIEPEIWADEVVECATKSLNSLEQLFDTYSTQAKIAGALLGYACDTDDEFNKLLDEFSPTAPKDKTQGGKES